MRIDKIKYENGQNKVWELKINYENGQDKIWECSK